MQLGFFGALAAASSMIAITAAAPAAAQLPDEIEFSLPAQDLAKSLREVSLRTGRNVIAPSELVEGRKAPAVSGRFTSEGIVRALLIGSELQVRRVGDDLVIMSLGREQEVPTASPPEREPSQDGQSIFVTGTNVRGAQPTSPTIVIRKDEIDRAGVSSVEQLMRKVPQNFAGGVGQENFGVVGAGADITEHGAGINLRGLGQRATLVLVNGRRLAPSGAGSFVDVSLIPISAVERVEIVTDGASAIYGSDAVGGVVNFILRDRFRGVETALLAGTATSGDGDQLLAGLTGGHSWKGGHALLSYEYRLEDPIHARDRDYVINLKPETTLFPSERRHSLFAVLDQALAPGLEIEIAGSWSRRDTERTYFVLGIPLPVEADARATSTSLAASVSYDLGADWTARLGASYSLSETEEMQRQPGAPLELVNLFDTRNELLEYELKADGRLMTLPAGAARLALGASARSEHYRDLFGTGTLASTSRVRDRQVRALYAELYLPVFSQLNRVPALESLIVTGALRYEDYDAFGSTLNPKVGALWSPVAGLTVRTSWSTSFRAPLLSEASGAYNAFYFPASLVSVAPVPAGDVALALVGSNPDIQPEHSRSWTIGAEFEPDVVPGLSLTATYYSIRFDDRIALPSPTVVVAGNPAFDPIVTRNPAVDLASSLVSGAVLVRDVSGPGFSNGGATPASVDLIVDLRFNNTAVTTTRGFDFGLRYPFSIGRSSFVADANANYILDFDDRLTRTAPPISGFDRPYRPSDLRIRAGLSWSLGPWSASFSVDHTDGYSDRRAAAVRSVRSFSTVDAGIAFDGGARGGWLRGTRVALIAQNLLDSDPPRLLPDPGATSGLGYDPVNATGRGRVLTLQLRKSW